MPDRKTIQRAREAQSPSTQAGEFVREEIEHVRSGKHGARSAKQAIAIGLSKARKAGVKLPPQEGKKGPKVSSGKADPVRSRAAHSTLEREGAQAVSHAALSRQAHRSARQRGSRNLSEAARKSSRTKGPAGRRAAAVKAARTRRSRQT